MSLMKYASTLTRIAAVSAFMLCVACSNKQPSPSDRTAHTQTATPARAASAPTQNASLAGGEHYLGIRSLGMSFNELLNQFSHDGTQEADGYLWVLKGGKALFGLSDKNDLQEKTAWMIEILSPDIATDGGIHVGMPIKELLAKYPDLSLDFGDDEEEMFAPDALQHGTPVNPDTRVFIYVQSAGGGKLSTADLSKYPTKEFSTEGVVSRIQVYVTGNRSPKAPNPTAPPSAVPTPTPPAI